jgi:hypothetical protein
MFTIIRIVTDLTLLLRHHVMHIVKYISFVWIVVTLLIENITLLINLVPVVVGAEFG